MQFRLLNPNSEEDINDLQKILVAAPSYHILVEGDLPGPCVALETLQELPLNKSSDDKHVFAIHHSGKLIGCFDMVKDFPHVKIAFIGLLLFVESEQGKSHGVEALQYIERLASQWGCTHLRIAVIETNRRALAFWTREGFTELYRKPSDRYTGDAIFMERALSSFCPES
jgi:diamine N-acetyltransferase